MGFKKSRVYERVDLGRDMTQDTYPRDDHTNVSLHVLQVHWDGKMAATVANDSDITDGRFLF
jgi:hypothetical protein